MKRAYLLFVVLLVMVCVIGGAPVSAMVEEAAAGVTVGGVSIDLTQIVTAVLGVLATVITAYVVPWLKGKIGEVNYRMAQSLILVVVESAEQRFGPGAGKEKLNYVKRELERRGMTVDVDEIEAAVYNLGRAWQVGEAMAVGEIVEEEES